MDTSNQESPAKKIILGVSGGIAAYKTPELVRSFRKKGAEVQVVMTESAGRFVTPLTLGTVSGREVVTEIFPASGSGDWTRHVSFGLWADVIVIAPATAHTIATLAHGLCDSMLAATVLAARCPIVVCPSMDHDMYLHPATQDNLERLRRFGYVVMPPEQGELASGLVGYGRLPEPEAIVSFVYRQTGDRPAEPDTLSGKHVLVTAGPTREAIDPVRYLSNHSSGRMGYALAEAARDRGARVTLISGPTQLAAPEGIEFVPIVSAEDLFKAAIARSDADLVVMAAAVADYTPAEVSPTKIKKKDSDLSLPLKRTQDVLAAFGRQKKPGQVLVGFALETDHEIENARKKLEAKNLDWIVLNNPGEPGAGFGVLTNRVTLIRRDLHQEDLPLLSKREVADAILDRVTPG